MYYNQGSNLASTLGGVMGQARKIATDRKTKKKALNTLNRI